MQLIIWTVLLALVFILFIAAEYLDVVLHVAAFGLLFILGVTMMTSNLTYTTGQNITQSYTYNGSNIMTSMTESRVNNETTLSGGYTKTLAILICTLSVFGFVLVYANHGKKKKGRFD
jgi:putative Mn2+ efflux pump MntP